MTYAEREAIFSKDYLTIKDVAALVGTTYQVAARLMRQIKFKTDRLKVRGKLHVEDYFEYYHITDRQNTTNPKTPKSERKKYYLEKRYEVHIF